MDEKGGIRANVVIKVGEDASMADVASGKYGCLVRTFEGEEHRKPIINLENQKLEEVKSLAKQFEQSTFRGIVTTRRGLAVRTTREGLANAQ